MAAALAGTGAVVIGAAPAAQALTKAQADRIALATLKPQLSTTPDPVVFGLPAPLSATDNVVEAGITLRGAPPTHRGKHARSQDFQQLFKPVKPLGRRTWLFWFDMAYPAKFQHPSKLLLIDDKTGKVRLLRAEQWWPLIDGHDPPFIAHRGAGDARYRIFSTYRGPAVAADAASAGVFGAGFPKVDPLFAHAAMLSLPGTCVVSLVDIRNFSADSKAFLDFWGGARRRHLRPFRHPLARWPAERA